MMYLFARKRAAAAENLEFQKRLISCSVVMRCSKRMRTARPRLSVLCPNVRNKTSYQPETAMWAYAPIWLGKCAIRAESITPETRENHASY